MFITFSGDNQDKLSRIASHLQVTLQKNGIPSWRRLLYQPIDSMRQAVLSVVRSNGVEVPIDKDTLLDTVLEHEWLTKAFGTDALTLLFDASIRAAVDAFEKQSTLYAIVVEDIGNDESNLAYFRDKPSIMVHVGDGPGANPTLTFTNEAEEEVVAQTILSYIKQKVSGAFS